jgi:hypothetical protein
VKQRRGRRVGGGAGGRRGKQARAGGRAAGGAGLGPRQLPPSPRTSGRGQRQRGARPAAAQDRDEAAGLQRGPHRHPPQISATSGLSRRHILLPLKYAFFLATPSRSQICFVYQWNSLWIVITVNLLKHTDEVPSSFAELLHPLNDLCIVRVMLLPFNCALLMVSLF